MSLTYFFQRCELIGATDCPIHLSRLGRTRIISFMHVDRTIVNFLLSVGLGKMEFGSYLLWIPVGEWYDFSNILLKQEETRIISSRDSSWIMVRIFLHLFKEEETRIISSRKIIRWMVQIFLSVGLNTMGLESYLLVIKI